MNECEQVEPSLQVKPVSKSPARLNRSRSANAPQTLSHLCFLPPETATDKDVRGEGVSGIRQQRVSEAVCEGLSCL